MENGKYLASIMDKVICDDVIGVTENKFYEKKNITYITNVSLFYLPFY